MDLKNFLPGHEKKDEEYFWALIIEPGWVQSGVWIIKDNKVQIVSISPSTAWELDEELTSAVDATLSSAVQNFPEEVSPPTKTVFGVNSSWVSNGQIKEEYLEKIKKICSELTLTPVGFVILPEAVAHYFKSDEGAPLNAIVLGVSKDSIEVSLFRLGNLVGISQVARSVSIVDDVTEGLARFISGEAFPSRIILFDGKEGELEEIRQDLIKANWEDYGKIKFLHTPKIEILTPEKKIYAVSLAGGAEMGDIEAVIEIKEKPTEPVLDQKPVSEEENIENVTPEESLTPKDFGFTLDEDVAKESKLSTIPEEPVSEPSSLEKELPGKGTDQPEKKKFLPLGVLSNIKSKVLSKIGRIKKPKINIIPVAKPLTLGIVFFILILALCLGVWWFYPKATITIFISSKSLDDKITVYVDPSLGSADYSKQILPGEVLQTTTSGDKTASTTGTKTVGDKATGEITIYRAGTEVSLASGLAVHGPGGLDFTLDDATDVASGSVITRGTTKTKVTAKDIGAQYNLASGATFTIGNYSSADMEGTNEDAFSGGSSREINAVSDSDQKNLLSDLTSELEDKAKTDLDQKIDETKILINDSIKTQVTKKDFNNKVGDEATSLKLNETVDVTGVAVQRDSLIEMAKKSLAERVPQGFALKGDEIQTDFQFIEENAGVYEVAVLVKADLLPQVDPEEIVKNISGKYPTLAEDYLNKNIPGFSRAEIRFNKPRFPGRLGTLPRVSKNIDVIISAEK